VRAVNGLRLAGGVVIVAVLLLAAPATSASRSPHAAAPGLHGGSFFSNCRFSHTAPDDPIVFPRQPGRSHPHTFFGNTSTNAYSTPRSLRRAGTTCTPRADTAAYWVPTLLRNGREVRPPKAQIYYIMRGYDRMRPFPPGLRMIAGDAHAMRPQSARITYWACGARLARTRPTPAPPAACPLLAPHRRLRVRGAAPSRRTFLELHVNFPDCWDGRRLDSRDHQSHMAYSRRFVCPRSHPVKVPLVRLMIRYPISMGDGVVLSSGGRFSGHADFLNGWDQRALAQLVGNCFHDRCNEG
jgi:hypothetical protein